MKMGVLTLVTMVLLMIKLDAFRIRHASSICFMLRGIIVFSRDICIDLAWETIVFRREESPWRLGFMDC
jgi:hypothetical protein